MKFLSLFGLSAGQLAINDRNFVLVPDGYRGTFDDLNVTELIEQNKEDSLFQKFENKFNRMRFDPETTIDEFKTMNKIKMVKNLILYLQDVPRFGKFFNYGCHCFRNEGRDYLKEVSIGKPQDRPDKVCRDHSRCHACIKMDFGKKCEDHKGYQFAALKDSVTNTKYIQCLDSKDSCHRALCECDKALAYDLADSEGMWSIMHHTDWGAFKANQHCDIYNENRERPHIQLKMGARPGTIEAKINQPINSCCGEYPRRYPYHSDDGYGNIKNCCGNETYNPATHECCEDDTPREIGMCVGISHQNLFG